LTRRQIAENLNDIFPPCPWERENLMGYSSLFARRHIDILLETLLRVDPANTSVEDVTHQEPHMFAHSILRELVNFEPQFVLEKIAEIFDTEHSGNWVVEHGLLITLSALCVPDCPFPPIREFIETQGPFLLAAASSPIDRVSNAALCALRAAIECYSLYVTPETIIQLVEYIESLLDRDPHICISALEALNALINRLDSDTEDSPLADLAVVIDRIYTQIVSSVSDLQMIKTFYKVFELYITKFPPKEGLPIVAQIVAVVSELLRESLQSIDRSPLVFTFQEHSLSVLGVVFEHYGHLIGYAVDDVVPLIFEVMRRGDDHPIVEALDALSGAVSALRETTANILEAILDVIHQALASGSPYLITASVVLIACLFWQVPGEMMEHFQQTIELIASCLDNDLFSRELCLDLWIGLSLAVWAVVYFGQEIESEIAGDIFGMYQRFGAIPLDLADELDFELGNLVYEMVFSVHEAVIRAARGDPDFLCSHREPLFRPASEYLKKFASKFADKTLMAFMSFMEAAMECMPRKRCISIVTRMDHKRLLIIGESRRDARIRTRAGVVLTKLLIY
jgi:hypothetical protein